MSELMVKSGTQNSLHHLSLTIFLSLKLPSQISPLKQILTCDDPKPEANQATVTRLTSYHTKSIGDA